MPLFWNRQVRAPDLVNYFGLFGIHSRTTQASPTTRDPPPPLRRPTPVSTRMSIDTTSHLPRRECALVPSTLPRASFRLPGGTRRSRNHLLSADLTRKLSFAHRCPPLLGRSVSVVDLWSSCSSTFTLRRSRVGPLPLHSTLPGRLRSPSSEATGVGGRPEGRKGGRRGSAEGHGGQGRARGTKVVLSGSAPLSVGTSSSCSGQPVPE